MDAEFMQQMRESNWSSICRGTSGHLELMSNGWSQDAYDLVADKVRQFVSQPAPRSDDELQERFMQRMGLSSVISSVSHIELMAGKYPNRNQDRIRLVKIACALKLPNNSGESGELHAGISAISMQVASLSWDELALATRR